MANSQPFDEVAATGGAAPGTIAEATRQAERRAGTRARAAAESAFEQAHVASATATQAASRAAIRVEAATSDDPTVRTARKAGALAGNTLRYVRDLRAEDVVAQIKSLVRRNPAVLAGAAVLGFVTGRLLRR